MFCSYIDKYTKQIQKYVNRLEFDGGRQVFVIEIHAAGEIHDDSTYNGIKTEPLERFEFEFQRLSEQFRREEDCIPESVLREIIREILPLGTQSGEKCGLRFQFVFKSSHKVFTESELDWIRLNRHISIGEDPVDDATFEPLIDPVHSTDKGLAVSVVHWSR